MRQRISCWARKVSTKYSRVSVVLSVSCLVLLYYTAIRAAVVPFSHDESYGYLNAFPGGLRDALLLSFRDANNHPLNTWAMYVCSKILGQSEFFLRLPNLLSHILYLVTSAIFVRRLPDILPRVTAFFLLNASPFALEYFSLARGYGIAMGFLMCASWLSMESVSSDSEKHTLLYALFALVSATLSVFGNYTFLHFYLSLCACLPLALFLKSFVRNDRDLTQHQHINPTTYFLGAAAWNTILLFLFAGREIMDLKQRGALYEGGNVGFWWDTIGSLVQISVSGIQKTVHAVEMALYVLFSLAVVFLMWSLRSKRSIIMLLPYMTVAGIALISALSAALQPYLFGVRYLSGRTAIQFIPLIGYLLIFLVAYLTSSTSRILRLCSSGICIAILVFLTINIFRGADFSYPPGRIDADTKAMIADLSREYEKGFRGRKIRLGINWELEPSINFYRKVNGFSWLERVTRDGLVGEYDYYYYLQKDRAQMEERGVKTIRIYPLTGNTLARRVE